MVTPVDVKRDVTITAAEDTHGETHFSQMRREATGLAKGLATMIAIVDPVAALTPNSINQVAIAALLTRKNQTADQDNSKRVALPPRIFRIMLAHSLALTSEDKRGERRSEVGVLDEAG